MARPHVVVVGGGFGGLTTVLGLRRQPVQITLIDRRNFHLFQPLLYQVATGGLSPANIAAPLRAVIRRQANARVLLANVIGFDVTGKQVLLEDETIAYDTLVVAAGARHHYFGNPAWEKHAPGLKTIEDATEIRRRVLLAFERAERETDEARRAAFLTFVVVGAGPTGVELAGAVAELAMHTLRGNFRAFDPARARVLLVEGGERVLPAFVPSLSAKAARALERLGVTVWTQAKLLDVRANGVKILRQGKEEEIATHTVLWGAGVQASRLGKLLAEATGTGIDRAGRVEVQADLTLSAHPEVFVIGDMVAFKGPDGTPLPGVAPVAMQQGKHVAATIGARLRGQAMGPFVYKDKGSLATIGRNAAVADLGWIRFSGYFAWLAWLVIHILFLVTFDNRLLVVFQWCWSYLTRGRSARLITGEHWMEGEAGPAEPGLKPNEP